MDIQIEHDVVFSRVYLGAVEWWNWFFNLCMWRISDYLSFSHSTTTGTCTGGCAPPNVPVVALGHLPQKLLNTLYLTFFLFVCLFVMFPLAARGKELDNPKFCDKSPCFMLLHHPHIGYFCLNLLSKILNIHFPFYLKYPISKQTF